MNNKNILTPSLYKMLTDLYFVGYDFSCLTYHWDNQRLIYMRRLVGIDVDVRHSYTQTGVALHWCDWSHFRITEEELIYNVFSPDTIVWYHANPDAAADVAKFMYRKR